MNEIAPEISYVAGQHDIDVTPLVRTGQFTSEGLERFRQDLAASTLNHGGLSVALTGSFARRELSAGSDCDFLVLVDSPHDHSAITELTAQMKELVVEHGFQPPGQQGVFGDFAIALELLSRIGLDGDTNINTTRRVLLLFESVAILNQQVRADVIRKLLERYCADYHPDVRGGEERPTVPRFLLNDVVRYWRTVTVDFGAKQWRSVRKDWYLRYAKLITTRKIFFAGTLAGLLGVGQQVFGDTPQDRYTSMISYLEDMTKRTPLATLMGWYPQMQSNGKAALASILSAYAGFLAMLRMPEQRKRLRAITDDGNRHTDLRHRVESIGEQIQDGLEVVFFQDPIFEALTRRYGLF